MTTDKQEAEDAYRDAWIKHQMSSDPIERRVLEETMDRVQPFIARGPGPEWNAFTETLPGFPKN